MVVSGDSGSSPVPVDDPKSLLMTRPPGSAASSPDNTRGNGGARSGNSARAGCLARLHDRYSVEKATYRSQRRAGVVSNRAVSESSSWQPGLTSLLFPLLLDELPFGAQRRHRFLRIPDGHHPGSFGNQRLHDQTVEVGAKFAGRLGRQGRADPASNGGMPGALDVPHAAQRHRLPVVRHRSFRDPAAVPPPCGRRSARRRRGGDRRDGSARRDPSLSPTSRAASACRVSRAASSEPRRSEKRLAAEPKISLRYSDCPMPMIRSTWSRGVSDGRLDGDERLARGNEVLGVDVLTISLDIGARHDQRRRIGPRRLTTGDGSRIDGAFVVGGVVERSRFRQRRRLGRPCHRGQPKEDQHHRCATQGPHGSIVVQFQFPTPNCQRPTLGSWELGLGS